MDESKQMLVRRKGKVDGPWSVEKLRSEIELRKLGRHHEVSLDGGESWKRAGKLEDLFPRPSALKVAGSNAGDEELDLGDSGESPDAEYTLEEHESGGAEWYYCLLDDTQHGPMTIIELAEAVLEGRCPLDALAWKEGYADWVQIEEVPEVAAVLAGPRGETGETGETTVVHTVPEASSGASKGFVALGLGVGSILLSPAPPFGFVGLVAAVLGASALQKARQQDAPRSEMTVPIASLATGLLGALLSLLFVIGYAIWYFVFD